jgi:hypothetical protein
MRLDIYHIFLGRPWKFDKKVVLDGVKNKSLLENGENKFRSLPMKEYKWDNNNNNCYNSVSRVMMYTIKEFLKEEKW